MLSWFLLSVNNTATSAENKGKNGYFAIFPPCECKYMNFLFPAVYLRLKLTDAASSSCLYQRSSLKPTTFFPLGRCPFST